MILLHPGETATTGGSTRGVIEGSGSIIDRSGGRADPGVLRVALATLELTAWAADFCPLCREGIPVEKPGSRPTR